MSDPGVTRGRWSKRPGLARAYRVYAMVGPLLTLLGAAFLTVDLLPPAGGPVTAIVRWAVVAAVALAAALVVERTLRRLLPVAALLDLDLGFPGAAPTRSRIASLSSLRGGDAELDELLPMMAPDDVEAAAEHLIISYASGMRGGLRPRSHAARVRAVATLLAERLELDRDDIDRFQWALLLREMGAGVDDHSARRRPMIAWLGPWSALLRGPFIDVATRGTDAGVATAAHAAAVADAYVVVTAAHPYERSLDGGSRLPLEALAAERLSPAAVDALVDLPVRVRRRAAGFTSGVPSRLLGWSPTPQPAFALASVLAVLALVAGGIGTAPGAALPAQVAAVGGPAAAAVQVGSMLSFPPSSRDAAVVEAADRQQSPAEDDDAGDPKDRAHDTVDRSPRLVDALAPGGPMTEAAFGVAAVYNTGSGGGATTAGGSGGGGKAKQSTSSGSGGGGTTQPSSSPKPSSPKPSASPSPSPKPSGSPSPQPPPPPPSDPVPAPDPDPAPGPAPAPDPDPDPVPAPDADPDADGGAASVPTAEPSP